MALLLLLDLWIQNEDRSLSEFGGNPNLLVTQIPPLPDDDPEGRCGRMIVSVPKSSPYRTAPMLLASRNVCIEMAPESGK
jgi:hypothetical protein